MKSIKKSLLNVRTTALASVILFSALCYVCILHLNDPTCLNTDQVEEVQQEEAALPEAEMMKTVVNKARDLFTVVTKTKF